MEKMTENGFTLLTQGDSVTDAGWRSDPEGLGNGYPKIIAKVLSAKYPNSNIKVINRGISGNRSCDLVSRWQSDCLDLKPDTVSILIGVNDCWRHFDSNLYTSPEEYGKNLEIIMDSSKKAGMKIIAVEPFVLPCGVVTPAWYEDLILKIYECRRVASAYADCLIPMGGIFAANCIKHTPDFWTGDGVHPNINGHRLIAEQILNVIDK